METTAIRNEDGSIEHPGVIFNEFIIRLSVSMSKVAKTIGLSRATLHRICHGKGRITTDIAARIQAGFGIPAQFFLDQQTAWDVAQLEWSDYSHIKPVADSVISQYALKVILDDFSVPANDPAMISDAMGNQSVRANNGAG